MMISDFLRRPVDINKREGLVYLDRVVKYVSRLEGQLSIFDDDGALDAVFVEDVG